MTNVNVNVKKMLSVPIIKFGIKLYACVLPIVLLISIVLKDKSGVPVSAAVSVIKFVNAPVFKSGTQLVADVSALHVQVTKFVLAVTVYLVQTDTKESILKHVNVDQEYVNQLYV